MRQLGLMGLLGEFPVDQCRGLTKGQRPVQSNREEVGVEVGRTGLTYLSLDQTAVTTTLS